MISLFLGEMQQLRNKLVVAERTAKAEAQLKEKYQLRFKVLGDKFKASPNGLSRTLSKVDSNGQSRRQSFGGVEKISRSFSNGHPSKKINGQSNSATTILNDAKTQSGSLDSDKSAPEATERNQCNPMTNSHENGNGTNADNMKIRSEDFVSGMLYDMLQNEVITLRKVCHEKEHNLKDKDETIEMLVKKVETLNKAMEVEAKKMKRELAAMERDIAAVRISKEQDQKAQRVNAPREAVNGSRMPSSRNTRNP